MLPDIGELSLILALFFACIQMVLTVVTKNMKAFKAIAIGGFISVSVAFLVLIKSFVASDFSVSLVANNSHALKPLIYKVSGAWANHEGSMLMWVLVLAFFNMLFALFVPQDASKRITLNFQGVIIALFTLYTITLSNPFIRIFPIPISGLGLNPILQDIGLALHPPVLYLGYVGFSIAYASSLAALICNTGLKVWAKLILPFVMLSWSALTIGITLGSWWAYRELGWGGYWFWDPVENASLIPWLSATALFHALIVAMKSGYLKRWSVMLAILTFPLSCVGTFLVRSGSITSVHSFAVDPARGIAILAIVAVLIAFGISIYLLKNKYAYNNRLTFTSIPFMVAMNNIIFIFFTAVIITGTFYPLVLEIVLSEKISVGAPYYNELLAPTVATLLALCIIAPKFGYKGTGFKWSKVVNLRVIASAVVALGILYYLPEFKPITALVVLISIHLILENLEGLIMGFIKRVYTSLGMVLAHLGFGILALSISINSLSQIDIEKVIRVNESLKLGDYMVTLRKIDYYKGHNYLARIATFEANDKAKFLGMIYPETRLYPIENQQTAEAGILHTLFYDLYISIGETNENKDIVARIYVRPMISFIWFGGFLVFAGGMISMFRRLVMAFLLK
jgi:cytochrome c-type biogenesis protein CcmF